MLKNFLKIFFCVVLFFNVSTEASENSKPKNIIIMIGDGMGINQVFHSVLSDNTSVFKNFKTIGLSITKSANDLITDSAAGATAISTGYRTYNGAIGVDTNMIPVKNLMEYAQGKGLSTGIVATSSITHATPASFVAHAESRKLEFDIAEDIIKSKIDLAIGGGRKYFMQNPSGNLTSQLKQNDFELVENFTSLKSFSGNKKLIALLAEDGLIDADKRIFSLKDLTSKAIEILSKNENGFILLIEGSQIDWAAHGNEKEKFIAEMKDFEGAISEALNFAQKDKNTLLLVTGDHETGGLSIIDGEKDGSKIEINFASTSHTGNAVGIFSYGPGEESFRGFFENYEIGRTLIKFLEPSTTWK